MFIRTRTHNQGTMCCCLPAAAILNTNTKVLNIQGMYCHCEKLHWNAPFVRNGVPRGLNCFLHKINQVEIWNHETMVLDLFLFKMIFYGLGSHGTHHLSTTIEGRHFWFTSSKHLTMQIQESESVRNGCDFKRPWNSHLESPFLNMCVSLASIAPPEKKVKSWTRERNAESVHRNFFCFWDAQTLDHNCRNRTNLGEFYTWKDTVD